jgi:hypothetical protein
MPEVRVLPLASVVTIELAAHLRPQTFHTRYYGFGALGIWVLGPTYTLLNALTARTWNVMAPWWYVIETIVFYFATLSISVYDDTYLGLWLITAYLLLRCPVDYLRWRLTDRKDRAEYHG